MGADYSRSGYGLRAAGCGGFGLWTLDFGRRVGRTLSGRVGRTLSGPPYSTPVQSLVSLNVPLVVPWVQVPVIVRWYEAMSSSLPSAVTWPARPDASLPSASRRTVHVAGSSETDVSGD